MADHGFGLHSYDADFSDGVQSLPDSMHSSTTSVAPVKSSQSLVTPIFSLPNLTSPSSASLSSTNIPFRAQGSHHHSTWARTFHSFPEYYIKPQSIEEVQKIVALARRCRRRIVVVGSCHSPSDLTCTSAWMMDLRDLNTVQKVHKDPNTGRGRVLVQAGISLGDMNKRMATQGLIMPNLGSINVQSIAGAIATGTHGSSHKHGILSQSVRALRIVLADGSAVWCSAVERQDLFRAALVSLGALGIITDVEFEMVPATDIEWFQDLIPLDDLLSQWNKGLWTQAEFVRCWWMPYMQRAIVWKADKTTKPRRKPQSNWIGGLFGFQSYRALLWLAHWFPRLLPTIEWLVFGMDYGFTCGHVRSAVQPQEEGLLMDCLYSQFVNEWALPLSKGPEAIGRMSKWLNGDEVNSRIPFSSKNLYVHCPIEVRVTDGSMQTDDVRGLLDPTMETEPTLYLNATLYRPFGKDPPCREHYYEAFEWLMKEMGGRPHWAKNFSTVTKDDIQKFYGADMDSYLQTRREVDPDGMFVGAWLRRNILGNEEPRMELEEKEVDRRSHAREGGVQWYGAQAAGQPKSVS